MGRANLWWFGGLGLATLLAGALRLAGGDWPVAAASASGAFLFGAVATNEVPLTPLGVVSTRFGLLIAWADVVSHAWRGEVLSLTLGPSGTQRKETEELLIPLASKTMVMDLLAAHSPA